MDKFNDKVLYQSRQHTVVLIFDFLRLFCVLGIPILITIYFIFPKNILIALSFTLLLVFLSFARVYFFWSKSYFIITNKKIAMKVRNGIFSKYHMNIYFKNIRDLAYSKNNIIHYVFGCGSFFARSSAGASGDFEVYYIPNVEEVYKIVNNVYLLSEEKREHLDSVDSLEKLDIKVKKETLEQIIEKEKDILLGIQGIKEVVLLNDADKVYIFEHEEDKNHGVYESLRKKVLFAISHDSTFRDPDEAIVYQKGDKVIFPTVKFHEIKRNGVVSSSPGLTIHNYLIQKFKNLDTYNATVLVGFDLEN